jgi:hypothetical protein
MDFLRQRADVQPLMHGKAMDARVPAGYRLRHVDAT